MFVTADLVLATRHDLAGSGMRSPRFLLASDASTQEMSKARKAPSTTCVPFLSHSALLRGPQTSGGETTRPGRESAA